MKRLLVLVAAAWAAAGTGCAGARYVQRAGDEGVVAVADNSDVWPNYNRTNALKLIEQHVGPSYEIVEEREVTTGQATTNTQNTNREATVNGEIPFLPAEKQTTTSTSTTRDLKEYHIHYRRRMPGPTVGTGSGMVPAGGVPPAGGGVVQTGAAHTVSPAAMTQSPGLPPPDLTGTGVGGR